MMFVNDARIIRNDVRGEAKAVLEKLEV